MINTILSQFKELWLKLDKKAKIIVGASTFGLFALILLLIIGGGADYQILFNNLHMRDADAIVTRLEDKNIQYKITNNSSTVLVPNNQVHRLRLEMAGAGLPSQGVVGFELFDESNFGTTDFEKEVNYYRALSGELSRSIQNMENVEYAKVQITAPKESLFAKKEKPVQGSVLLQLRTGSRIKDSQIIAISNLVASSVQDLDAANVTIVDTAGNLLSRPQEGVTSDSQLTLNNFEVEREFAKNLQQDLKILLSQVLGLDNFTVQVQTKLNFDQRQVQSKTFEPIIDDQGIIRSQQNYLEVHGDEADAASGIPGTESNIPNYQGEEVQLDENGTYRKSETTINYEINERIEEQVYAPGEVEKLSVAVMVKDSVSDDVLTALEESIQAAVGFNENRGDIVTVTSLPFNNELEDEMQEAIQKQQEEEKTQIYVYGGIIAGTILILFILIIILRKSIKQEEDEFKGQNIENRRVVDYIVEDEKEENRKKLRTLTGEEKRRIKLTENIMDLINQKPEDTAQSIRAWLLDDD
ncbi:MAG: flagellar basal-body MS-ring/collar protein FliF [bacterium]